MFEEIDLQIADETSTESNFTFTMAYHCTYTGSGGYGTSCKYCC